MAVFLTQEGVEIILATCQNKSLLLMSSVSQVLSVCPTVTSVIELWNVAGPETRDSFPLCRRQAKVIWQVPLFPCATGVSGRCGFLSLTGRRHFSLGFQGVLYCHMSFLLCPIMVHIDVKGRFHPFFF